MEQLVTLSRALGEQGMQRTLEAEREEWVSEALQALQAFAKLPGWQTFKTEDFRYWWLSHGGSEPHAHHCWGAVTNVAAKKGLIRWTGKYVPSVSPKTHGHPVKQWSVA
jgi:hypothetical protein